MCVCVCVCVCPHVCVCVCLCVHVCVWVWVCLSPVFLSVAVEALFTKVDILARSSYTGQQQVERAEELAIRLTFILTVSVRYLEITLA